MHFPRHFSPLAEVVRVPLDPQLALRIAQRLDQVVDAFTGYVVDATSAEARAWWEGANCDPDELGLI